VVNVLSFTEAGAHQLNEDVFVVQQHPLDPSRWLCFVADGQGGQAGGGAASELACQTALAAAADCSPPSLDQPSTWSGILETADKAVNSDPTAGLTTLVGFCISREWVVGASVGDSAVLLLCRENPIDLTSRQHKNPPVGSGATVAVAFSAPLSAPWLVLAMTDGVWKYVGWQRLVAAARDKHGAALVEELQQLARLPGSGQFQDDFTLVLLAREAARTP
jgi:PPM family protein phosphatase